MTGNVTDLGIEFGKMLYWNHHVVSGYAKVRADWWRVRRTGGLLVAFIIGGIVGAAGFKSIGFVFVAPLAVLLFMLVWKSMRPNFSRNRIN